MLLTTPHFVMTLSVSSVTTSQLTGEKMKLYQSCGSETCNLDVSNDNVSKRLQDQLKKVAYNSITTEARFPLNNYNDWGTCYLTFQVYISGYSPAFVLTLIIQQSMLHNMFSCIFCNRWHVNTVSHRQGTCKNRQHI